MEYENQKGNYQVVLSKKKRIVVFIMFDWLKSR